MLTDYHLHLQPDGQEARDADCARWDADGGFRSATWIGRYVERAQSRAVTEIAITEHVHRFAEVRDWHPNPWWQEEATEDLGAHCAALVRAREDDGLPVLVGIEMDWIPERVDDIRALLPKYPGQAPWLRLDGLVDWSRSLTVDARVVDYAGAVADPAPSGMEANLEGASGRVVVQSGAVQADAG